MKIFSALAFSILMPTLATGCGHQPGHANIASNSKPKNIILMIGDGMGPQQIGLLQDFARYSSTTVYKNHETAIEHFANTGQIALSSPNPFNKLVVDSACSATQLATGKPALSEVIGLDAKGNISQTILEKAKSQGMATGLITDTRITHATPAAFAAHQPHRSMENEIAIDILQNNVDVLLGGGLRHWIPQGNSSVEAPLAALIDEAGLSLKSKRRDTRNLLAEARDAEYQLAFNNKQLQSIQSGKVLGLFASSAMKDGIAYSNCKAAANCIQPSLAEMTNKALDLLASDEDGFFLMIEGGQIDWAGHNNDAGDLLHEMLKFDEAVQAVYDWVKDRNDTLVLITADHETGGFGFSYNRRDVPQADSSITGSAFTASGRAYHPNFNFVGHEALDKLYAQKKDFYNIWYEAGGNLTDIEPTPEALQLAINNNTAFTVSLEEAQRILEHEPNHYQTDGNTYLATAEFPKVDDFEQFYVYAEEVHLDLIGRALAKYQNTVWSTGTHTHTPVEVIAWGPYPVQQQFHGLMTHVDVGNLLMQTLDK